MENLIKLDDLGGKTHHFWKHLKNQRVSVGVQEFPQPPLWPAVFAASPFSVWVRSLWVQLWEPCAENSMGYYVKYLFHIKATIWYV